MGSSTTSFLAHSAYCDAHRQQEIGFGDGHQACSPEDMTSMLVKQPAFMLWCEAR